MQLRLEPYPWARRGFVAACGLVAAAQCVLLFQRGPTHAGDYGLSREFGRRFLNGEDLYAHGLHYPYMPSAAMYFAPLAMVGFTTGLLIRYCVALLCLSLILRMLQRMAGGEHNAQVNAASLTISAITLVLASHYIVRDLDDGGPHLILLAVLLAGVYSAWRGRDALGGLWFGLATALKAPCGLFLPFFAWKRQWRLTLYAVLATLFWVTLPAVRMGPTNWWREQRQWAEVTIRSALGTPTPGAAQNEQRIQNQALRPAIVWYVTRLWPPDPRSGQSTDEESRGAGDVATAAVVAVLAGCCWVGRHRFKGPTDPAWLLECSAVMILTLLLSPLTWVQHVVMIIPALYLIVAQDRTVAALPSPARVALALYVILSLLLNRQVLGREGYLVLLSYRIHTVCMLIVLGLLVLCHPAGGY